MKYPEWVNPQRQKEDWWLPRVWQGLGGMKETTNEYEISLWVDENVLKLTVVIAAQFCE